MEGDVGKKAFNFPIIRQMDKWMRPDKFRIRCADAHIRTHPVDTRHMTSTRLFLMFTIYDSLTEVWALVSLIVFFYIHVLLPAVGLPAGTL